MTYYWVFSTKDWARQSQGNTVLHDDINYKLVLELIGVQYLTICHARLGTVVSVQCSSCLLCVLCTGDQVH